MLDHDRDIFDAEPPFLVLYATDQWKVAIEVHSHPKGIAFKEPFGDGTDDSAIIVPGTPWHMGDNVWEFDYGTRIMTLDHPNYHKHPAWQLWLYWLQQRAEQKEIPSHPH